MNTKIRLHLSNFRLLSGIPIPISFNEIADNINVAKMKANATKCILSTKEKLIVAGMFESATYLFATDAKRPPILSPNLGSTCDAFMKKARKETKNEIYKPLNSLKNKPQLFLEISITNSMCENELIPL